MSNAFLLDTVEFCYPENLDNANGSNSYVPVRWLCLLFFK